MSEQITNPKKQIQAIKEPNRNSRIEIQCLKGKTHWMKSIAD